MRFVAMWLAACSGDPIEPVEAPPKCDGVLQVGEERIDSPFDRDGDGFFDANDPGCAATYDSYILDCDDDAYDRHPEASEYPCNGVDDDCNPDTPDALDLDRDGSIMCDDCDDNDPLRSPDQPETCWDLVDNDCDGVIDPDCGFDYNGIFVLEQPLVYTCSLGLIKIGVESVTVLYNPPFATVVSNETAQPTNLDGEVQPDGSFVVEGFTVLGTAASCDEYYRLTGNFVGADRFEATFEAVFNGFCLNCQDLNIPGIVGVRAQ